MKKMFLSAFAVAALLFVGCTNDLTQDKINGGVEAGKPMVSSLTANINSMTRTSLESPEEGKTAVTLWSEGDVIGVITEENKVRKATLVKGAGTTTASFDIEGEEGDVYTAAFYPYIYNGNKGTNYSAVNGNPDNGSIGFNFPVVQFYDPNSVFATNTNTMVGIISGDEVSLYSTMAALEIRLKGSQTVHGITVKTADYKQKMAGPGVVEFATAEPVMGTANTSFSFIDLEVPGVKLNPTTATSFYVVLPAGEYKNLAIGVVTEDGSYMRTATKSHTVGIREILPINCGNLDEMVDKANAIDLCGGKYANCYIVVPEAGKEKTYSFDIKRVDGSVVENHDWFYNRYVSEESTSYPGNATEEEIAPSFAHLLWAEDLGVAYDIHFDKAAGKVYFKNKAVGNARIMVMMNPNGSHSHVGNSLRCDNNVIWGWHIWACNEQPKTTMTTQPYSAGGGSKGADNNYHATREQIIAYSKSKPLGFMDRNLGATYAPKSIEEVNNMTAQQAADALGLYFQAGNLHPYPRPIEFAKASGGWDAWQRSVYQYGFHQYSQSWASSTSFKNSLAENWQLPYYQYSQDYTPNDMFSTGTARKSWLNMDFGLGGTATSKPIALWGGSGPKLNYDPCPKGYKVPHQGNIYQICTGQVFKFTETGAETEVDAKGSTFVVTAQKKVNDQTVGSYITYDNESIDFHPAGGYAGGTKITWNKTGNLSYFWGSPYVSGVGADNTKKAFNAGVKGCFASTPSDSNYTQLWPQPSTPYQIRCIKE